GRSPAPWGSARGGPRRAVLGRGPLRLEEAGVTGSPRRAGRPARRRGPSPSPRSLRPGTGNRKPSWDNARGGSARDRSVLTEVHSMGDTIDRTATQGREHPGPVADGGSDPGAAAGLPTDETADLGGTSPP